MTGSARRVCWIRRTRAPIGHFDDALPATERRDLLLPPVDAAVVDTPWVLIGSGARRGKLVVPGKVPAGLPGAVVVESLGL